MVRAVHGKLVRMKALQNNVAHPTLSPRPRVIRAWLLLVAALVFLVAAVGGGTRLTGSGLSLVEWQAGAGVRAPNAYAADGIRTLHRGVAAGGGRAATDERGGVAVRIRQIQGHSAIPGTQSRHE